MEKEVTIGVVGKYTNLKDSYKSLIEALTHGGIENNAIVKIHWINAEKVKTTELMKELKNVDGILIPGGFGYRGVEGKILAIKFARENNIIFSKNIHFILYILTNNSIRFNIENIFQKIL